MTLLRSLARWTMAAAAALAPADRAPWADAMRAEFETLDEAGPSLDWAAGCFASALGWRVRTDAAYLTVLAVTFAAFLWVDIRWITSAPPGPPHIFNAWQEGMLVTAAALLVLGGLATAAGRPPRIDLAYVATLAALIVAATGVDWIMWDLWTDREAFFTRAHLSTWLHIGLPCLALTLFRRKLAPMTVLMVLLTNGDAIGGTGLFIAPMLADPFVSKGNHPDVPNLVMALLFSWTMFGPALVGATAGWILAVSWRRYGRRAA